MKDGTNRLILFNLQGERYALRLGDVAEVIEPPPIYPIPRAPRFFHGIINFHGTLVSVLDLADFLKGIRFHSRGQLLALDSRIASLALLVESVESVRSEDVVQEERAGDENLVEKVLIIADREVVMLSVEKLVDRLEEILMETGKS